MPIPLLEPSVREKVRRIRRRVLAIEGVRDCEVSMDSAEKKPHVLVWLVLEGNPWYEGIHGISSKVDHEVRKVIQNSRISIRSEPEAGRRGEYESVWQLVKRTAEREPGSRGVHNIHLQNLEGKLGVDFHLEVSAGMNVEQADEVTTRIERKLMAANPQISEVVIHTETSSERVSNERLGRGTDLIWYIDHVVRRFPEASLSGPPVIRRVGEKQLHVIIRASFKPETSMETANQVASKLEAAIKAGFPAIVRVDVVNEPLRKARRRWAGQPPS